MTGNPWRSRQALASAQGSAASDMSDGILAVTVRKLGRPAILEAHVDDAGDIAVNPPPPGSFTLDPSTESPELRNVLASLEVAALEKKAELRKQAGQRKRAARGDS
jgi:hypothetical protein